MNAAHIEIALRKEFLSRRRRWWWWPLGIALAPAALALALVLVGALAQAVGLPFETRFAPIDFRLLHRLLHGSVVVLNLWLLLVSALYLARPLRRRGGADEALFWRSVGLETREVVAMRALLVTLVLPAVAALLALAVLLSLGAIDLGGLLVTGGPVLSSAASLLGEGPVLALLAFTAFLVQGLWLMPLVGGLLVCASLTRRGKGPAGHPLVLAVLVWVGLLVLGGIVRPLGRWLGLLVSHDPLLPALRFDTPGIHLAMLLLNVLVGLALLALAARLDARPAD